jgi:hypothetical protein
MPIAKVVVSDTPRERTEPVVSHGWILPSQTRQENESVECCFYTSFGANDLVVMM